MKRTILLATLAASIAAPAAADVWSWGGSANQYVSQYAVNAPAYTRPVYTRPVYTQSSYARPAAVQQSPCANGPMISTAYARPCSGGPVWGGGGGLSFNNVVAHYERWLNHFEGRIRTGEMNGLLTRPEARRARMRQQEIARLLGDARMDNQISHGENQRLGQAIERQARRLERMSGNYRRMHGAAAPMQSVPPVNLGQYQFRLGGAPAPASSVTVAPAVAAPQPAAAATVAAAAAATVGDGSEKWLNW